MPRNSAAKRYHHGDLRNALIIAAAELIEESGSEDFAMVDAARRAGVSSAAPYRHFRDKEDLLRAVGDLGFCGLGERMVDVRERFEHGSMESIIEMGCRYIAFVTAKPAFFDVMWGERGITADEDSPDVEGEGRMNGFYQFVDQVRGWCEREQLSDEDPMDLAMKLWAMAMGLSQLAINHNMEKFVPEVDHYAMLTSATRSFLNGVAQGQR